MKKKSVIFLTAVCLAVLAGLTSCENFLKGADIKRQLEDQIAYANAASCTIYISAPEGTGSFLSAGEKECRVGYTTELQFTVNAQNYIFKGMKAVSSKDNSQSRNDYVQITTTPLLEKQDTYKIIVKLLKTASDILIIPDCVLIPKINSVYPPQNNTSYPQDSSIKIYFNKAINLSDFADQDGFLKNMTITTGTQDLLDTQNGKIPYYKSPYLDDEGKTLVIPVVGGKYLITEENADQIKDIKVTLQLAGLKDGVKGENASFSQNEYIFTYTINGTKDSTPPVLKTINIARTQEDARNGTNLITFEKFIHYAAKAYNDDDSDIVAENIQNHHVNKIWVYFEAEDVDSGIDYLEIKEMLIRDNQGAERQGIVFDKSNSENSIRNIRGKKYYSECFEYDFKSFEDGVVNLTFELLDCAGKSCSKEMDLVKDTICDKTLMMYNDSGILQNESEEQTYEITLAPSTTMPVYIIDMDGNQYLDTYVTTDSTDFSNCSEIIGFEYGYDEKNLNYIAITDLEEEIKPYNDDKLSGYYKEKSVVFNANPYNNIIVKAIIMDTAENITAISYLIPATPEILFNDISNDEYQFVLKNIYGFSNNVLFNCIYNGNIISTQTLSLIDDSTGSITMISSKGAVSGLTDGDYTFRFFTRTININGKILYSYKSKDITIRKLGSSVTVVVDSNVDCVTQNDVPQENEFSVSADNPVVSSGERKIHLNYQNFEPNPKFRYLIYYEGTSSKGYSLNTDFSVPSEYGNYSFKVVAVDKNYNKVESVPKSLDLSYDNVPPVLSHTNSNTNEIFIAAQNVFTNKSTLIIKITDHEFGTNEKTIKYILSSQKNESINWNSDPRIQESKLVKDTANEDYWTFDIVYYEQQCPSYCYVCVKDVAGNSAQKQFQLRIDNKALTYEVKYNSPNFTTTANYGFITIKYINTSNSWANCSSSNLSFTNEEKNSFILLLPGNRLDVGGYYSYWCFEPKYFYPKYLIAKGTQNPIVCDLKDIYIGQAGINILADQPCFAHTMYCPRDLGESPTSWLNGGLETGLVMKQKSFTYSYDNISDVPKGNYYTTLVHFADGTVLMTDVKQK